MKLVESQKTQENQSNAVGEGAFISFASSQIDTAPLTPHHPYPTAPYPKCIYPTTAPLYLLLVGKLTWRHQTTGGQLLQLPSNRS